jgi:hypothetical protein|tara:strand:- start:1211 stop:1333 length:123 start_codon:yes stop_codon:yes gene_type:complete
MDYQPASSIEVCVNHLFKPIKRIEKEGHGDCTNCTPDENN